MENECHELDQEMIMRTQPIGTSSFLQYQQARVKLLALEEEQNRVKSETEQAQQVLVLLSLTTTDPLNNSRVQAVSKLIQENTDRLHDIVSIVIRKILIIHCP